MKKVLILFAVLLLVSCSSDSGSGSANAVLLQKIIRENPGSASSVTTYVYDGKKMKSVAFDNSIHKFFYSGNRVSKVETYDSNVLGRVIIFTYNSEGQLTKTVSSYIAIETTETRTYTYNSDNTVSTTNHAVSEDLFDSTHAGKIFLDPNGEISRKEEYYSNGTETTVYTYDDKHNPMINVTGFDKLLDVSGNGIRYNVVTQDYTSPMGDHNLESKDITYDDTGFPLTMHIQGNSSTEHYVYQ